MLMSWRQVGLLALGWAVVLALALALDADGQQRAQWPVAPDWAAQGTQVLPVALCPGGVSDVAVVVGATSLEQVRTRNGLSWTRRGRVIATWPSGTRRVRVWAGKPWVLVWCG